jgi:magnesium chelatase family protein
LLDRIDIHVEVPRVDFEKLSSDRIGERSADVRERVERARELQRERFRDTALACNADMGPGEIRKYAAVGDAGKSLIQQAMKQIGLTARGYHRVLKLALTIADLAGVGEIETVHLAEALQFRPRRWA